MHLKGNSGNGPLLNAAKMALKTGNVNYVLAWIPEESEKKMKNLFEKTFCKQRAGKDEQDVAINWYFKTVNRFHCAGNQSLSDCRENARFDEWVLIVQKAIETGDETEVIRLVPKTSENDVIYRFRDVMEKKNPDANNVAAGRAYVVAFIDFIRYFHRVSRGRWGNTDSMEH
jgi:hypothetical protein